MPLLEDIKAYLVGRNLIDSSWPLYLGYFPDDIDQTMGVFDTGGFPADTIGRENERLTFQFRIRGKKLDYPITRAKWQSIFDALQDSTPGSGYAYVQAMHQGPLSFNDDKGRTNMTSNFRVMKAR